MNKIFLIVLSVFLVALAGCGLLEKEVDGSVFVVTQGGENIKLGLTPVAALTKEEFESIESANIESVNRFYDENSPVYKKAKAEYDRLYEEKYDPIYAEFREARANYSSLVESLSSERSIGIYIYDHKIKVDNYFLKRDSNLIHEAKNIQEKLEYERLKVDPIHKKYQDIRSEVRQYEKIMDGIADYAKNKILTYQRSLAEQAYELAQIKTKTNADGEFRLILPKNKDYVLIAFADRSVGDSTEEYNWFISYASPQSQKYETLISNDNLASDLSPVTNNLYEFKNTERLPLAYWDIGPIELITE